MAALALPVVSLTTAQVIAPNPNVPDGYQVGMATVSSTSISGCPEVFYHPSTSPSPTLESLLTFFPSNSKTVNPLGNKVSAIPTASFQFPSPPPLAQTLLHQASSLLLHRHLSEVLLTTARHVEPATVSSRPEHPTAIPPHMILAAGTSYFKPSILLLRE